MAHSKVAAGQPLAFSAGLYNTLVDMASWWQTQQRTGGGPVVEPNQAITLLARNEGTSAIPKWGCAALRAPVIIPSVSDQASASWQSRPIMSVLPGGHADAHPRDHWLVIAQEPIAENKIGRVAVAGVTQARINGTLPATDGRGELMTNQAGRLRPSPRGRARILWVDADTNPEGNKWCLVSLEQRPDLVLCRTGSSWTSSSPVALYWANGSLSEIEDTPTRVLAGIGPNQWCALWYHGAARWLLPVDCDATANAN